MSSPQSNTQSGTPSQVDVQSFFHRAVIYWKTNDKRGKPCDAWMWISTSLRWIRIKSRGAQIPKSLECFRGQNKLAFKRLPDDAKWEDVEAAVEPIEPEDVSGYALAVSGNVTLHRAASSKDSEVSLVVVTQDENVRDAMVDALRIRISPWKLLYLSLKNEVLGSDVIQDVLRSLFTSTEVMLTSGDKAASSQSPSGFADYIRKVGVAPDVVDKFSGFIQTVLTFVKTCSPVSKESVEKMCASIAEGSGEKIAGAVDVVQKASDIAKCVTIVGSVFQAAVVVMTLVDLGFEMNRGSKELLRIKEKVGKLRESIVKSIIPVLHPNGKVDNKLIEDVFKVQEQSLSILGKVEDQMMSSKVVRFLWANELKTIEGEMNRFEDSVLRVLQTGEIAGMKIVVEEIAFAVEQAIHSTKQNTDAIESMSSVLENNTRIIADTQETVGMMRTELDENKTAIENMKYKSGPALAQLRERPSLTSFFVGREEELGRLERILDSFGAAAIMQYGGIGKTQLAVAFVELVENKGLIPGGSFWVPLHGNKPQAISAMANFAEAITERAFHEKDRQDFNVILRAVKGKLRSMKRKWLLVLDNADNSEVGSMVGELCKFVGSDVIHGWVLVTSRRGGQTLWTGMRPEQQVKLEPLTLEQSMIVLWRWKKNLLPSLVSDEEVWEELMLLKKNDEAEYRALSELAGSKKEHGVDGLPLALAQAGSFVYKMRITFVQYVEMYNEKRRTAEVPRMFTSLDERGLEMEHQRTVWTTWKLNVDTLSDTARVVLSAFALFDTSPVPEEIVDKLDSRIALDPVAYLEVVRGELMDDASLLQEYQGADGSLSFGLHRMLRNFVELEVRKEKELYADAQERAIIALHTCVGLALESTGHSISNSPRSCSVAVGVFLPHTSKVLVSFSSSGLSEKGAEVMEKVIELFFFTTRALISQGRTVEASPICTAQYEVLISTLGERSSDRRVIWTLFDMGEVALENGTLIEAMKRCRQVLHVLQQAHGYDVDHDDIARALHQMGIVAQLKGQYEEAREWYRKSLEMKQRVHGDGVDHPDIASSLHQMGMVAELKGLYDEALTHF